MADMMHDMGSLIREQIGQAVAGEMGDFDQIDWPCTVRDGSTNDFNFGFCRNWVISQLHR